MIIEEKRYNIFNSLNEEDQSILDEIKASLILQFPYEGKLKQKIENNWIKNSLIKNGWKKEAFYPNGREKCDFKKETGDHNIYIEVEFRQKESIDHDLGKFSRCLKSRKVKDIFVLVVLCDDSARKIKSNIASFGHVKRVIEESGIYNMPLIVLGINVETEEDILDLQEFSFVTEEEIHNSRPAVGFLD